MNVTGEYRLAPGRQTVWNALNDPAVLKRCIPGCEELTRVDAEHYRAKIKMVIGPLKASFDTELRVRNAEPPRRYRLEGEGKGGAVGFGRGHADVSLAEDGAATVLRYAADLQVGGRLAQVGSRLIAGATRKIADDFFARLASDIDAGAVRLGPDTASAAGARRAWVVVLVVAAAVIALIWWLAGAP